MLSCSLHTPCLVHVIGALSVLTAAKDRTTGHGLSMLAFALLHASFFWSNHSSIAAFALCEALTYHVPGVMCSLLERLGYASNLSEIVIVNNACLNKTETDGVLIN